VDAEDGFQWNFTKRDLPLSFTRRKVWTPKPSIMRRLRGMARSDMTHMIMCMDSGIREMKSQKVSWAEAAWGISLSGSGFTAWTRSGNLIASWMKKTGMLFPTRSKIPLPCRTSRRSRARRGRGRSSRATRRRSRSGRRRASAAPGPAGSRPRVLGEALVDLEVPVRGGASCVDHALGNALVVEVGDLLAEVEVLEQ
jgi:hypothetical protein